MINYKNTTKSKKHSSSFSDDKLLNCWFIFHLETASSRFGAPAGGAGRPCGAGNGCNFCCCGVSSCQDRGVCVCFCCHIHNTASILSVCFVCEYHRTCWTSLELWIQELRWRSMRGKSSRESVYCYSRFKHKPDSFFS